MYIKVVNGIIEQYPYSTGQLAADHPNTSFPENPNLNLLAEFNVFPVTQVSMPTVDYTKNVTEGTPVLDNGEWKQVWVVNDVDPSEAAKRLEDKSNDIRTQRNRLLSATDWTQIPDSPLDINQKQLWSAYREDLRDLPDQPGFPWTVSWPQSPGPVDINPMFPFFSGRPY